MRTWHRAAVAALLLCPVAGSDSERFDEQICEMCGILVHKLETLHGALESEPLRVCAACLVAGLGALHRRGWLHGVKGYSGYLTCLTADIFMSHGS